MLQLHKHIIKVENFPIEIVLRIKAFHHLNGILSTMECKFGTSEFEPMTDEETVPRLTGIRVRHESLRQNL
jgi:hypothetical protein